jgi:hypothetical protein
MRRLGRRFRFSSAQKNGLKLFQLKKNVKETFSVQERKEEEKDISNSRVAKECSKFCVFLRDSRDHHFLTIIMRLAKTSSKCDASEFMNCKRYLSDTLYREKSDGAQVLILLACYQGQILLWSP